jgi:hypothetical protein
MGIRHGGRQAGTPNRRSQEAIAKLDELGFDPLVAMVEIALDPTNPPELRGRMAAELAGYCYPKLRASEHTADVDVTVNGGSDADELRRRLDALRSDELEALETVSAAMDRIAQEKVDRGEMEERQAAEQAAMARMSGARH